MPDYKALTAKQMADGVKSGELLAVELAKEALLSSTQRDTGSGCGIDIFTISKDGIKKVVEQEMKIELKNQ